MLKRGHAAETLLAAVIAACGMTRAWSAAPDKEYSFDIPKQPLYQAILTFDTQAGLSGGVVSDKQEASIIVGPLRGNYTADKALKELLKHTDFEYEWIGSDTISVYKKISSGNANAQATAKNPLPAGSLFDDVSGSLEHWGSPGDIVIVTGTRISSIATESQSATVLTKQKIESSGASTVPELLAIIPQIPYMRGGDSRQTGEQYADLRGLGPTSTLVLINGRRTSTTATSFDTGGFDLNTIPLTAVKRIEILLDSPSVSVGADAPAGIVNIVLKSDIPKPIAEIRYGGASGGAEERRASLGFGSSGEKFHSAVTLDVFDRAPLYGDARDLSRNQDYRRYGGLDLRSTEAIPGNVFSALPGNLPGLNSPFAGIPAGGANTTPADFAATAGLLNRTSSGQFHSVVLGTSQTTLVSSADYRFSADLIGFAELLGTRQEREYDLGPATLSNVMVPASNAFNPFHSPVLVSEVLQSLPTRSVVTDTDFIRALAGIRKRWDSWEAEVTASWTDERASLQHRNELDPSRVAAALAGSDRATALNVFGSGPAGSQELLNSLITDQKAQRFSSTSAMASARLQGPLFELPAGTVNVKAGGDWRREELSGAPLPTDPHRIVASLFAEIQVPLISSKMQIPLVSELSASLGSRADDYEELASRVTSQYGIVWRPVDGLKVKANYSESYRLPTLYELYGPTASFVAPLPDPRRNNQVAPVMISTGGNAGINPSPGHSWSAGFEITPGSFPNLRLSAGYWNTTLDDYITALVAPFLVAHESLFPGRVTRAASTPIDVAAGIPGAIQTVHLNYGNFGELSASGVDLGANFAWETEVGRFTPTLAATWTGNYTTAIAPRLPADRVGVASELGSIPKWRGVASLEWSKGAFTVYSAARFISHYDDVFLSTRTSGVVPAQTLLDLQASMVLDSIVSPTSMLSGVRFTAGATNLLDKAPHFAQVGYTEGYDLSQGDLRQRFWYARLSKEF